MSWGNEFSITARDTLKLTPTILPIPEEKISINSLFLDSGAFGIFARFVSKKSHHNKNEFFKSPEFWKYIDEYGEFVSDNLGGFDYYANVDAIRDAKTSWKVQKYLEKEYDLNPIPVVHYGTPLKWLRRHLDEGYDLIGLGGIGQGVSSVSYMKWADTCFDIICDTPDRTPRARIHGFAMTTYKFLHRYPWWSVDSTSWAKWPAYGIIYIPSIQNGEYIFPISEKGEKPGQLSRTKRFPCPFFVSQESPRVGAGAGKNSHIHNLVGYKQKIIHDWLDKIQVPFGSRTEWGVMNSGEARIIANLRFFELVVKALPKWPWSFWSTVDKQLRQPLLHSEKPFKYKNKSRLKLFYSGVEGNQTYTPDKVVQKSNLMVTYWSINNKKVKEPNKRVAMLMKKRRNKK